MKAVRHHQQEDDDTEDPENLTRRLVGAVVEPAEDMNDHGDEEDRDAMFICACNGSANRRSRRA